MMVVAAVAVAAGAAYLVKEYCPTSTGIANVPGPVELANMARLLPHFAAVRAMLGNATVNSGYRSPAVNAAIGGVPPSPSSPNGSRHMAGCALDLHPIGVDLDTAAARVARAAIAGTIGPVAEVIREPTWVHVGWRRLGEQPTRLSYLFKHPDGRFERLELPA